MCPPRYTVSRSFLLSLSLETYIGVSTGNIAADAQYENLYNIHNKPPVRMVYHHSEC